VEVAGGKMVFPYLDVRDLHDPFQSLTKTEKNPLGSLSLGKTNKEAALDHDVTINKINPSDA